MATDKAKDLVRMAVAALRCWKPSIPSMCRCNKSALVVGGGAAGMRAALSLAEQGFPVYLVEKECELGGNLRHVFTRSNGKDPQTCAENPK